jgi:hypothetical protein
MPLNALRRSGVQTREGGARGAAPCFNISGTKFDATPRGAEREHAVRRGAVQAVAQASGAVPARGQNAQAT